MLSLRLDVDVATSQVQGQFTDLFRAIDAQLDEALRPDRLDQVRKIYLTGCGDSYFAGLGARVFYEKFTGIPTEPVEAMELSRYVGNYMKPDTLVLAVSNSGRVSRTVEAIIQARRHGAHVVAMTGYADRAAASEANASLVGSLPNIRSTIDGIDKRLEAQGQDDLLSRLSAPGEAASMAEHLGMSMGIEFLLFMLGAYLGSLAHLYAAAIHIGRTLQRLSPSEADALKAEILRSVAIMVRTTYEDLGTVQVIADHFRDKEAFLYLGSGPSFGTASLSAAKLFEQPHLNGVAQYLEEWAHLQFFFTRPAGIPIFVIAPPGESRDRAIEQMRGAKRVGGAVVAICDSEDAELVALADYTLPIHGRQPEEFTPWTYGVPGQLLAVTLLNLRGQPPIPPPYSFKQMMQVNYEQVYGSAIRRT